MERTKKQKLKMINDFIVELRKDGQEWRLQDKESLNILKWLIVNNWTHCNDINDFVTLVDNCKDFVNLEIVNNGNYKEYEEKDLLRLLKHGYKYFEKLDTKKGFILHFPHIGCDGRCRIASVERIQRNIIYNLHEFERKPKRKRFVVIGGKWFDKINGNTYHRAKIIDMNTNSIYYTEFEYGYDSQYMSSARDYLRDKFSKRINEQDLSNGGSFYMSKKEIKNKWF